jgi:hypothetical protein
VKERPTVNAAQARELLAQGRKDGTYEAPIPDDDKKALSEATDLLDMAHTAWEQHVRGPEVEILLKMEANFAEGDAASEDAPKEEKPKRDEPKAEGEKPKRPRPVPKEPEPGPDPEPEPELEDLSQVEPWDGYDREKVSDIIAGVNAGAESYDESDFLDLMRNVWEYESAHKARASVLNHLEAVAKRMQEGEDPPPAPDAAEDVPQKDAEPQPDPEPDPEPEPEKEPETEEEKERLLREHKQRKKENLEKEYREDKKKEGGEYDDLMRQIDEELERERLHKPVKPPEDVDMEIPWDWTKMSDGDLRRLHGVYSAMAYYKSYHATLDERKEIACKGAADEIHNALML